MMNRISGNKTALDVFSSMFKSGRIPHSFLIYGDKGTGKKLLAQRLAMALLCENKKDGVPCGECRSCRNILKGVHPDVIYPEPSGKLMLYTVETCREVCADSYVSPNDSDAKVYIFRDCDNIKPAAQDSLLKIVEEPPDHVYFIFTASDKDMFLPTMISRVTGIPACACSKDECASVLSERGSDERSIKNAISVFGGNIGKCIEYIESDDLQEITALTKSAADSIIRNDEYGLLKVLSSKKLKERDKLYEFFEMLSCIIRDSVVIKFGADAELSGCSRVLSEELSQRLSAGSAERIHSLLRNAALDIKANVNASLVTSALCGEIMSS